jgi:hypothetical protein
MKWIHGMQDVFIFVFLAGLGVWVVAEFLRTFLKANKEDVGEENDGIL